MSKKWINEGGIFYPVGAGFSVYPTPGPGVFTVAQNPNPMDGRLGLRKIGEKFEFPFKIYDLGIHDFLKKVENTWNSEYFEKKGQNLGIIMNGVKGTGKTISAKILCNQLDLPVIVIPEFMKGLVDFIQGIDFEAVILIDECEKIFPENDQESSQVLLKIIDGVMNNSRKLYILTTNHLKLNENLLGRPGRIRYIQDFKNITEACVDGYIKDNLMDLEKTEMVKAMVSNLDVSTIDTLKAIVDEVNIHGHIDEKSGLNLTLSKKYKECFYLYSSRRPEEIEETKKKVEWLKDFIKKYCPKDRLNDVMWWMSSEKFNITMCPEYIDDVNGSFQSFSGLPRVRYEGQPCEEHSQLVRAANQRTIKTFLQSFLGLNFGNAYYYGSKIEVGKEIESFGKVTKAEPDGWFEIKGMTEPNYDYEDVEEAVYYLYIENRNNIYNYVL